MIDLGDAIKEARRRRNQRDKLDEALATPVDPSPTRERGSTISFSQMSTYLQCPKKWDYAYKQNIKLAGGSEATVTGTAVHETVQDYLKIYYSESKKAADAAVGDKELTAHFVEAVRSDIKEGAKLDGMILRQSLAQAIECVSYFKKNVPKFFPKRGWELVEIEYALDEPIGNTGYTFKGFIDVLLREKDTGRYVIIDFKVSRRGWNAKTKKDDEKVAQLRLYKHFLSQKLDIPYHLIDVEYHIFKKELNENAEWPDKRLTKFKPANGSVTVGKAQKLLNQVIQDITTKDTFEKTPSWFACSFCSYNASDSDGKYCDQPKPKQWNKK